MSERQKTHTEISWHDYVIHELKREVIILKSMKKYDQQVHPVGETLSDEQRLFRVRVIKTFLGAGVPLDKLDNFCELPKE